MAPPGKEWVAPDMMCSYNLYKLQQNFINVFIKILRRHHLLRIVDLLDRWGSQLAVGMSTSEDRSAVIDVRSMKASSRVLACHVALRLM